VPLAQAQAQNAASVAELSQGAEPQPVPPQALPELPAFPTGLQEVRQAGLQEASQAAPLAEMQAQDAASVPGLSQGDEPQPVPPQAAPELLASPTNQRVH
jgi:hypothetical protein